MFDRPEIVRLAEGLAKHATNRQIHIAENVANADTPEYRARDLPPFSEAYEKVPSEMRATRSGHVGRAAHLPQVEAEVDLRSEPAPNGNSVSLETEMIRQADTRRQHDMALAVYKSSLDLMRVAFGRGR